MFVDLRWPDARQATRVFIAWKFRSRRRKQRLRSQKNMCMRGPIQHMKTVISFQILRPIVGKMQPSIAKPFCSHNAAARHESTENWQRIWFWKKVTVRFVRVCGRRHWIMMFMILAHGSCVAAFKTVVVKLEDNLKTFVPFPFVLDRAGVRQGCVFSVLSFSHLYYCGLR